MLPPICFLFYFLSSYFTMFPPLFFFFDSCDSGCGGTGGEFLFLFFFYAFPLLRGLF